MRLTDTPDPDGRRCDTGRTSFTGLLRVAAIACFALLTMTCQEAPQKVEHTAAPRSPAASLDLAQANDRAAALVREGKSLSSLPYFRRQFELLAAQGYAESNLWAAHRDFASALHNAAIETGPEGPLTRSSFERVALLREALVELAIAESLVASADGRDVVGRDQAHTLWFWGFPWDAWQALDHTLVAMPAGSPERVRVESRRRLAESIMATPRDMRLRWSEP